MAFFSEFFFSTLIGKPVYTIDEKYYGNFRDFIVKRENGNWVITKVRIRNIGGERVIISWHDVHSLEAYPIHLKLKKKWTEIASVDYGDDEMRLKRDILDQQIIDTEAHRVVRVNDLKIVAVKDELFMVAADIGFRGLLRRIGLENFALFIVRICKRTFQNVLVPSKYIDPFPARIRHDITLTVAQDELKKMHPADLADIMEHLDSFERASILHSLPTEIVAKTVAELKPAARRQVLAKLKDETVTKLLERLAPDAATDIVSKLPRHRMRHLLNIMKQTEAEEIRELLQFEENTAGRIMNTAFVALPSALTVKDAIDELRRKGSHAEQIFYLYIVDEEGRLKGAISLRDLIFAEPSVPLTSLVHRRPVAVKIYKSINDVAKRLTKYNLVAIPVIGPKGKLEGVITVDDVLPMLRINK